VVDQGRTTFPALRHAKQLLDRVGAHTVGVVMNKVRSSGGGYSYSYGYGNYGTPSDGSALLDGEQTAKSEPPVTIRERVARAVQPLFWRSRSEPDRS
jgi:hypothetical protein